MKSSRTGGVLVNVVHLAGSSTPNPNHRTVDISPQAAGASDVQIWFHYWNGQYAWYWQLDNVTVTWTGAVGCNMHVCTGAVCGNGTVEAGEQCDDGNTQGGDCCSSACQYEASGSPCGSATSSTCTAPDSCSASGQCQANNAPNGTACSDGNVCTQADVCTNGACAGTPLGGPAEVLNQRFSGKTLQEWDPASGPGLVYDVVRGKAGEWPVGSGASEICRASGSSTTSLTVPEAPVAGSSFWFLVRARTACGIGGYGLATGPGPVPTQRSTSACP